VVTVILYNVSDGVVCAERAAVEERSAGPARGLGGASAGEARDKRGD